jgi:HEAT repeat protein
VAGYYIRDNVKEDHVISFLQNLQISSSSFWLGFLTGILFAWIISRLWVYLPKGLRVMKKQMTGVRESFGVSTEVRLRNDVYRHAQKQHLTANLFSLDEIAIVPKVLTPLIQTPQSTELSPTDSVSITVPYIPDWPELGAVYKVSTMTLIDALQGGANIILAGHPGSGKTVALAWLAAALARNQSGLGVLEGLLPLYIHAQDVQHFLHYKIEEADQETAKGGKPGSTGDIHSGDGHLSDDAVEVLIKAISPYASAMTLPRLPGIVRSSLEKQRAMLILDGMDELPPYEAVALTKFIEALLEKYPKLRMIVALSYEDMAGVPALGFSMLGMAAWGEEEMASFLSRWSRHWSKWIYPLEKNQTKKVNTYYLNNWLKLNNSIFKPLEYVLKVWAAYSGDIRGTDGGSAIEAYIQRMTGPEAKARPRLERFALQQLLDVGAAASTHESQPTLIEPELETNPLEPELPTESVTPIKSVATKPSSAKVPGNIDSLIENGFMVSYQGERYSFSHPIFAGYLAGNALSNVELTDRILELPPFIGKTLALFYLSYFGDVAPYINPMIQEDDILHTNHLLIARCLQVAPKNRPWRSMILRTLTTILQKEKETVSLAAKIISALAFSGDAGVSIYFRQLIKSDHPNLKLLAALGCGILADKKSLVELNDMLQEQSPASVRAASLAMAAIGDKQSLEVLATNLLNGNELMRRCAAEALANNPSEGHPALKEGSSMEDLMVRRAVAFGLIRINLPWAIKIVENMQLEDSEWVVRNAAIQAFDELNRKSGYAPKPILDLTEAQWLIDYAVRVGTTVAPGKPAEELVLKVLTNGTPDEILKALDFLRTRCDPHTVDNIYGAYSNNSGEIKDIAYYILWLMMISGIKLPTSIKYHIE